MDPAQGRVVGRYALYGEIASGGMATVHFGRLVGAEGFSRTVAIKRLHPQFAKDPEFVAGFLDEARVVARIRHPNVVPTLDVVATEGELFLVLDYVQGESLARLFRLTRERKEPIPPRIVSALLSGVLLGLHAAHEAKDEGGAPLGIVHRDVSPQNILVGTDGVARVLDFGVAKASGRAQTTRQGHIKGKVPYMAPEQLRGDVSAATDVYAASVVLWEALTGKTLFTGDESVILAAVMMGRDIDPPSRFRPDLSAEIDELTLRGLDRDPSKRFSSAREMARALEKAIPPVTASDVGDWVEKIAWSTLSSRSKKVAEIESSSRLSPGLPAAAPEAPPSRPSPSQPSWQVAASRGRSGRGTVIVIGLLSVAVVVALGVFAAQRKKPVEDATPSASAASAAPPPAPLALAAPTSSPGAPEPSAVPSSTASAAVTSAPHVATAKPKAPPPRPPTQGSELGSAIDSRK